MPQLKKYFKKFIQQFDCPPPKSQFGISSVYLIFFAWFLRHLSNVTWLKLNFIFPPTVLFCMSSLSVNSATLHTGLKNLVVFFFGRGNGEWQARRLPFLDWGADGGRRLPFLRRNTCKGTLLLFLHPQSLRSRSEWLCLFYVVIFNFSFSLVLNV